MQKIDLLCRLKDIALFSLVILLLCLVAYLFNFRDIERQESAGMKCSLAQTNEIKNSLKQQLYRYIVTTSILEEGLNLANTLLVKSRDLMERMLLNLKREKSARVELEKQILGIQNMLVSTIKTKSNLERKARSKGSKEEKVNLERITVKTGPVAKGRILTVNRKFGFVVVDLGREENLETGANLAVYRGDIFIGRLLIIRAEERVSAATIVPSWRGIEVIKEDDIVKTL